MSSLWASYRAVNSASVAASCSGVRAFSGEKRSTSFGMPLPTMCLNCSTVKVGQPRCAHTQFPASARSSMVFRRVPSRSNNTVFITEKDSLQFQKSKKGSSLHFTLRTLRFTPPGKVRVRSVRPTAAAHGERRAVRAGAGHSTQISCR